MSWIDVIPTPHRPNTRVFFRTNSIYSNDVWQQSYFFLLFFWWTSRWPPVICYHIWWMLLVLVPGTSWGRVLLRVVLGTESGTWGIIQDFCICDPKWLWSAARSAWATHHTSTLGASEDGCSHTGHREHVPEKGPESSQRPPGAWVLGQEHQHHLSFLPAFRSRPPRSVEQMGWSGEGLWVCREWVAEEGAHLPAASSSAFSVLFGVGWVGVRNGA